MIKVKLEGVEEALKQFDPKTVQRAARMAINDAARQTRTEASKASRDVWNLPASRVNKEVKNFRMATDTNLEAVVSAQGRPVGLRNFGAVWVRNVGGRSRSTTDKKSTIGKRMAKQTGVRVQLEKGKTTWLPHAFMARGRRGNVDGAGSLMVFVRRGGRTNLVSKANITIASIVNQPRVLERVMAKANEVLTRRFGYHLDRMK